MYDPEAEARILELHHVLVHSSGFHSAVVMKAPRSRSIPSLRAEIERIRSCGYKNRCNSIRCIVCTRRKLRRAAMRLRKRLSYLLASYPHCEVLHVTITAPECLPERINAHAKALKDHWQRIRRRREIDARMIEWHSAIELKPILDSSYDRELPHIHIVCLMRNDGRYYVKRGHWGELFEAAPGVDIAVVERPPDQTRLQRAECLSRYLNKGGKPALWLQELDLAFDDPKRYITRIQQLRQGRRCGRGKGKQAYNVGVKVAA